MKNWILNTHRGFLALTTVLALVACDDNSSLKPKSHKRPPVPGLSDTTDGTADTGGGNGLQGKVFESYIVQVEELEAFKKIAKKMFDNASGQERERDYFNAGAITEEKRISNKTWYIAPVDLEKIDKEVLGVLFFKDTTDQLAIQTKSEIWISKSFFDKMTLEEQADLILHELVMEIYLAKFVPFEVNCKTLWGLPPNVSCSELANELGSFADLVEEPRELNSKDYENIRHVVGYIKAFKDKKGDYNDLTEVLHAREFDSRTFGKEAQETIFAALIKLMRESDGNEDEEFPNPEIPPDKTPSNLQIMEAIQRAQLSGHMPTNCIGINSEEITNCEVKFENFDYSDLSRPKTSLTLKLENESSVIIESLSTSGVLVFFSARDKRDKAKTFYSTDLITHLKDAEVGTRTHTSRVVFLGDDKGENLKLVAFFVEPVVVTKIKPSYENSYCETATVKPDRPENLSWAAFHRDILPQIDRLFQIGHPSDTRCTEKSEKGL